MADPIFREFLLAFWKVHILHHAAERPVYGLWLLQELERHGYRVSPGTLYPILARMERNGWLRGSARQAAKARRTYRVTAAGRSVLKTVREQLRELHDEVEGAPPPSRPGRQRAPQ